MIHWLILRLSMSASPASSDFSFTAVQCDLAAAAHWQLSVGGALVCLRIHNRF